MTYSPCPEGCGGGDLASSDIVTRTFNYAEQNGYLKILVGRVGK